MNIKQAEAITGITRQNIRFYEKKGLLTPERNSNNDYREYGEEEIRRLKLIKILRKLGMPIEVIYEVLNENCELCEAVRSQKEKLTQEKENLEAAIRLCRELEPVSVENMDVDRYLILIDEEEKRGNVFMSIVNDFKKVSHAEYQKSFSFMPDVPIQNPKEFTDELFRYAGENQMDLTITKESMYPEFICNGVEYRADRRIGRFGAVVTCEMISPELVEPVEIPEPRKKMMKLIARWLPVTVFFIIILLLYAMAVPQEPFFVKLLCAAGGTSVIAAVYGVYWRMKP